MNEHFAYYYLISIRQYRRVIKASRFCFIVAQGKGLCAQTVSLIEMAILRLSENLIAS